MSRPSRQSSRLIAKRNQKVQASTSVPRIDDFRKVKGRRGKLRVMTEIPVDILLEIFSHVEPLDLLHLSWATKDLHALLTAARNAFLWRRVYENLPGEQPPPCPPGKDIVQYTNLLFGRVCQSCAANRVGKIVHWAGPVRICADCAHDKLLKSTGRNVDRRISSFCAFQWISNGGFPGNAYIMKSEYERHKQRWDQCNSEAEKAAYIEKAKKDVGELYVANFPVIRPMVLVSSG